MATSFLMFCSMGSTNGVAFKVGALGVDCAAGEGSMCTGRVYTSSVDGATGSGLLVDWAVAVGFNYVGNDFETSSWGSSTIYFPLLSSVCNGEIASFFSHKQIAAPMPED